MIDFSGQLVLITGATRGIGESTANLFEKYGANLILTGTNLKEVDKLNNLHHDNKRTYFQLDLSSKESIKKFISNVSKYKIDVLVNNAGINILDDFIDVNMNDYEKMLQINLGGSFEISQFCAKKMIAQKYGKIINICSIWSKITRPKRSVYTITKNALHGLTQTMSVELAKKTF